MTLGVGLLMLAAVPLGVWWTHSLESSPVVSVGSRNAVSQADRSASVSSDARYLARRAQDENQPVSNPTRVTIPRLDVNAAILPVGLDKAKAVDIPPDITEIGWYELGVPPGAYRGSAVLVGHRDGDQGRGAFYDLGTLDVGDRLTVTNADGQVLTYRVVARESIAKKRLPYEELFAVDGEPRLTLISCGGLYDPNNGGYQDNVVVTAVRHPGSTADGAH